MSSQGDAMEAVYKEIARQASTLEAGVGQTTGKAAAVRDLAMAYRFLTGGQQPGGVVLEK